MSTARRAASVVVGLTGIALVGLGWADMWVTAPLRIPGTLWLVAAGVGCLAWAWDHAEGGQP